LATGTPLPDSWFTAGGEIHRDPLSDPDLLRQPLTLDDLKDLSRRDLRILRNTVFARHGRPFNTATMRDWFERMAWYRVDPKYTDKRLTKVDLDNIKLIRSVENSIGGAETEEEVDAEAETARGGPEFYGA
jgi:hypothetical protein